ncbi:hypothetical protein D1872_231560 [compost metagenome]
MGLQHPVHMWYGHHITADQQFPYPLEQRQILLRQLVKERCGQKHRGNTVTAHCFLKLEHVQNDILTH